jgi:TonB family protein
MMPSLRAPLRTAINFAIALLLMALLFASLPGLRSLVPATSREDMAVLIDRKATLDMKKEEPKQRRAPTQMTRSIQAQAHTMADRVADESFKFAPDLSVQGGGDVAVEDRRKVASQVYSEDETDVHPILTSKTTIPYPPEAQIEGIEGVVEMEILVDESGRVVRIAFIQMPSELFRVPVSSAVMRWRFKPALVKGVAVSVRVHQKITFQLSQPSD